MKPLPHNEEAEKSALGAVLLDGSALDEMSALGLVADDFFIPAHVSIYAAMEALRSRGHQIDHVTLEAELKQRNEVGISRGVAYFAELQLGTPAARNVAHHARLVIDKARLRRFSQAAHKLAVEANETLEPADSFLDGADAEMFAITMRRMENTTKTAAQMVKEARALAEAMAERPGQISGVPTGYHGIDYSLSGMQLGDFVILAARPSVGKTTLALNMINHSCIDKGMPALMFSLESSAAVMIQRLACCRGGVDAKALRDGKLDATGWGKFERALADIKQAPFEMDDAPSMSIGMIQAKARRFRKKHAKKKHGSIWVDYLQLVRPSEKHGTREQEVAEVSRKSKGLAKELKWPLVCLCQLKRPPETAEAHEPRLSSLKESGSLEQDADVVKLLHRPPKADENIANVNIAKQRNGPTSPTNHLIFDKEMARFREMEKAEQGNMPF